MSSICDLYLVRHGETDWNAQGILQGHHDIDLNPKGLSQALELKERLSSLSFAATFSSDLLRAKRTAEMISSNSIPLIISKLLRERFLGPFEGRPSTELDVWIKQRLSENEPLSKEAYLSYKWHPELESPAEIYQRVKQFLDLHLPCYHNSNLLVVSHGGVIRSILDHFEYVPNYKWVVANCGFICLQASSSGMSLKECQGVTRKEIV